MIGNRAVTALEYDVVVQRARSTADAEVHEHSAFGLQLKQIGASVQRDSRTLLCAPLRRDGRRKPVLQGKQTRRIA